MDWIDCPCHIDTQKGFESILVSIYAMAIGNGEIVQRTSMYVTYSQDKRNIFWGVGMGNLFSVPL